MTRTAASPRSQEQAAAGQGAPVDARRVLLLGLGVELLLVAGFVVTLLVGRKPNPITTAEPLATWFGGGLPGLVRFVLCVALWLGAYGVALRWSERGLTPGARRALLLLPLLFAVSLGLTYPAASKDLYHYVMEGRLLVVHGENPLRVPPGAHPEDGLYWIMSSWEQEPSRYGPLWALIAAVPTLVAGASLTGQILVFKAINIAAMLAVPWLVLRAAGRHAPERALAAYVFIAWNPLFLWESAHSGHNDTVMLAFTALALERAAHRRWEAAFPALAAAALIKYVTGLLGPLMLLWAWRASPDDRRRALVGVGLGLVLTVITYAPFWEGAATFEALRGAADGALNSPGYVLRYLLERLGLSDAAARTAVSTPLSLLFVAAYLLALRAVWRAPERLAVLWGAGLLVLCAYVSTVAWWFWPWYITWLLPLAPLVSDRRARLLVAVWSAAALCAYVPINFRLVLFGETPNAAMPFFAALITFVPVAIAVWWLFRRGPSLPAAPD